jgi:peptidoglycan/xylan/chitin deacetylase (PgdA/CDA1 family)
MDETPSEEQEPVMPTIDARMPVGYDYTDEVTATQDPPGGLEPSQVPMFVAFGWDDNGEPDGMQWALDMVKDRTNPEGSGNAATYDASPLSMTFYNSATYVGRTGMLWKAAYDAGHEIGNHTETHAEVLKQSTDVIRWQNEIDTCNDALSGLGIPLDEIYGFRTPFLGTSDVTLQMVQHFGFWYDCSLEEGFAPGQDGTNFPWPYTLNQGSPGNDLLEDWGTKAPIEPHEGLWEMPVYAFLTPPDEECEAYGLEPGFRDVLKERVDYFEPESGKITGFDYNTWEEFLMTVPEMTAVLKYTLDQRLKGNRAPFLVGGHTDQYMAGKEERRQAIEDFLTYALTIPEVRVVSVKKVLDWVRSPVAMTVAE